MNKYKDLMNYSIPVYEIQRKQGIGFIPKQIGSASICKYHDNYYIITAGHVIQDTNKHTLSFGFFDDLLFDDCMTHSMNCNDRDFAIIEISKKIVDEIIFRNSEVHIVVKVIDFDSTEFKLIFEVTQGTYSIIGYPSSRSDLNYSKHIVTMEEKIISGKFIPENKFNSTYCYAIEYNRKHISHEELKNITGVFPKGMSGCPVWKTDPFNPNIKEFAGVFIEFHKSDKSLVVTRSEIIFTIMKKVNSKEI